MKLEQGLKKIISSPSKAFSVLCFCFLLGVAFISILDFKLKFFHAYICFFTIISSLFLFWNKKQIRFSLFCVFLFVFGIIRYALAFPINQNHISKYIDQKISFIGIITAEPDVRMDGVRYIIESREVLEEESSKKSKGRVYIKEKLYPRYSYGDKLEIFCRIREPEPIEADPGSKDRDFRYDRYLARFGVFANCQNPKIEVLEASRGNMIMRSILSLKEIVARKINQLWHEPHASFMAGLLYGYRGGLGSLNELFSRTGVTHIVAISGYNITIISTILITVCVRLLIPRKKAFWLIVIGIIVFLIFAGLSASVVRAGIMGIIVLIAKQLGRASRVGNVMLLTAVVMTLHNPFILIWDAGFQLSFISTLGLVYLTKFVEKPFEKLPEILGIKESVLSTLAAIISTLPLILYQFGRLSIVAPIVNVLILWIIPWIMIVGFFGVVVGFVFKPIAVLLAWISHAGMAYIILIVKFFAGFSFAAVDMRVPIWFMLASYFAMIWFVIKSKKLENKKSSG